MTKMVDEMLQNAKVINVNGSQVYYVNVDTNDGEIPEECWEDWD